MGLFWNGFLRSLKLVILYVSNEFDFRTLVCPSPIIYAQVYIYICIYRGHPDGQVKGTWPDECKACQQIMQNAGLDQASLVAHVRELQQKVQKDLGQATTIKGLKPLKPPSQPAEQTKVKREPDDKEESETKRIKVEKSEDEAEDSADMVQPGVAEIAIEAEALLDKTQLMELHGVKKLPKGDSGKKKPCMVQILPSHLGRQGESQSVATCQGTGAPCS